MRVHNFIHKVNKLFNYIINNFKIYIYINFQLKNNLLNNLNINH